jgi:hypothetical protein
MPTLRILLLVAKSCILRCCSNDACLLNAILVYRSAEDCHNSLPSLLLTPYGLFMYSICKEIRKDLLHSFLYFDRSGNNEFDWNSVCPTSLCRLSVVI